MRLKQAIKFTTTVTPYTYNKTIYYEFKLLRNGTEIACKRIDPFTMLDLTVIDLLFDRTKQEFIKYLKEERKRASTK